MVCETTATPLPWKETQPAGRAVVKGVEEEATPSDNGGGVGGFHCISPLERSLEVLKLGRRGRRKEEHLFKIRDTAAL